MTENGIMMIITKPPRPLAAVTMPKPFIESTQSGMYMPLNLQKRVQPNPLLSPEIPLPVAEDMIIVFPSNITHAVHPNRSSRPRVSIAIDTFFTLRSDVDDEEFFLPPLDKWRAV